MHVEEYEHVNKCGSRRKITLPTCIIWSHGSTRKATIHVCWSISFYLRETVGWRIRVVPPLFFSYLFAHLISGGKPERKVSRFTKGIDKTTREERERLECGWGRKHASIESCAITIRISVQRTCPILIGIPCTTCGPFPFPVTTKSHQCMLDNAWCDYYIYIYI